VVRFTVARDGRVLGAAVVRSSGFSTLDNATIEMLRGARVPAFPAFMPQLSITVTVPIRFMLE
jgi:periplasmic protein TonB